MLALVIGAYCEGLGLAFRLMTRSDVHSSGKYIVMYLFVVLSVGPKSVRMCEPAFADRLSLARSLLPTISCLGAS